MRIGRDECGPYTVLLSESACKKGTQTFVYNAFVSLVTSVLAGVVMVVFPLALPLNK
jgi:hypothetical protein